jgi:hypothetical protein
MTTTITQLPLFLSMLVYDKDGSTKLFEDELILSPGLQLPTFPEVGGEAEFNVGGTSHQAMITQKLFHYNVQTGNAITAKLTIVARKNANAPT